MKNQSLKTSKLVMAAMFTAIILIMSFTPYLGYIPLGFMNATIIHIPVIIGAIILGPVYGGFLGGIFGLTSLINNTVNPNLTSFVFSPFYTAAGVHGGIKSLIVCFVPRILIGIVAYYIFTLVKKLFNGKMGGEATALVTAGVAGSLTNTLLVMNGIFVLFGSSYASARGLAYNTLYGVILTVIGTQGVPEAIVAGILTGAIGKVLLRINRQHKNLY